MALPTDRDPRRPFDPPGDLLGREPISRMTYLDGHEGWLVTGYAAARPVLADPRFSSRMELRRSPTPHAMARQAPRPALGDGAGVPVMASVAPDQVSVVVSPRDSSRSRSVWASSSRRSFGRAESTRSSVATWSGRARSIRAYPSSVSVT